MDNNDKKIYNVKITCNGETIRDFNSDAIALSATDIDEDTTSVSLITSYSGFKIVNVYNGLNELIDNIKKEFKDIEFIAKVKSLFNDIIEQGDK